MLYEFQHAETGRIVELDYPMAKAPKLGSVVLHEGLEYVRVPSVPRTENLGVWRNRGLTSNQWHPWVGRDEGWHKNYDAEGRPQFVNKTEAKRFADRYSESHPDRVVSFDP